jgi:hypothetical protein
MDDYQSPFSKIKWEDLPPDLLDECFLKTRDIFKSRDII